MQKPYLISSDLDYSLSISPAAGPVYAERMVWPTLRFDEVFGFESAAIVTEKWMVVDNRLSERECELLVAAIMANPERSFVLKVIDPYYEWCRGHWYYKMLFDVAKRPNVWFLTPYQPAELVSDLDRVSGGNRMAVIPYPYPADVEQPLGGERKPRVLFSGNQHRDVYPFRFQFGQLAKWWPPARRQVETLGHPGYPDIGQERKHEQIGKRYVEHLAGYMFMFVSPSRCRLEFLKYGECAAAGCLPIGALPRGLPEEAARAFVELDFDSVFRLERSLRHVFQMPPDEISNRISVYRESFQAERNSSVLNDRLRQFLDAALLST